jgi:ABC transport system ATP-binding/permease protein
LLGERIPEHGGGVSLGPGGGVTYVDSQARREQVRYVPQDDDLYQQLSVAETLGFAARLRSASDITRAELATLIDSSLEWLGLESKADKASRVGTLSGGERKRVSIGVELVGRPQLLLLDEPTSGLDLGKDRAMMRRLRELSRERGCTVVLVTHSTAHLDSVDRVVVLAADGRLRYQGPPREALRAAGQPSWADWFDELEKAKPRKEFATPQKVYGKARTSGAAPLTGLLTALHRQALLLARRGILPLTQLVAMPAIGSVIALSASDNGLHPGPHAVQAMSILVTVAALTGASLSYQDLAGERAVLRRDWRVGIGAAPFVFSKALVFGGVCGLLSLLMTAVFGVARDLPAKAYGVAPALMLPLSLFLVMLASMALGLWISALARSVAQAVTFNTLLAVLQVALNGALFPLESIFRYATMVFPARLGLSSMAGYAGLNGGDPLWSHHAAWFWSHLTVLAVITVAACGLATIHAERRFAETGRG